MAKHQPSTTSAAPPAPPTKWDLSHGGGIDTDLLGILIQERNFHHEQIMAINGRLGWVILALAASIFVGGEDLRNSLRIEPTEVTYIALGLSGFFLLLGVWLTTLAVVEHWRMRMVWIRRFERAIECYTHGMSIEDALHEAEQIGSTRSGAQPWSGLDASHDRPVMLSAIPDRRPCELSVNRYASTNVHMRFGMAAGALLLSAFCFAVTVLS